MSKLLVELIVLALPIVPVVAIYVWGVWLPRKRRLERQSRAHARNSK